MDSSHLHLCLVADCFFACFVRTVCNCGGASRSAGNNGCCETVCAWFFFPLPLLIVVRVYGANSSGFSAAELSAGLANESPDKSVEMAGEVNGP